MRRPIWALAACLLATGCSDALDLIVRNPCAHPVAIRTFDYPPDEIEGIRYTASATVAAQSTEKIEDAFTDGGTRWTIRADGTDIEVARRDLARTDFSYELPAAVCR